MFINLCLIKLSIIYKRGYRIGVRGGVENEVSNSVSPRSESWKLGELDITSPDLRSVCLVPGLKSMLRMCGGEASSRSTEPAYEQQQDDKSVTRSRVGERCWVKAGGAGTELRKVVSSIDRTRAGAGLAGGVHFLTQ